MTFLASCVWLVFISACVANKSFWHLKKDRAGPLLRGLAAVAILLAFGVACYLIGLIVLHVGEFLLLPAIALFHVLL